MERLKNKNGVFDYKGVVVIIVIYAVIGAILFLERSGIQYDYNTLSLELMPKEKVVSKAEALEKSDKECLVLYDSGNPDSRQALEQFEVILTDMKVGYDEIDLSKDNSYSFDQYKTAVILISDLTALGERLPDLDEWVYDGGGALFPLTQQKVPFYSAMERKFGVLESSYENVLVDSIYVEDSFMVGGGKSYGITDAWDSALTVQLDDTDTVKVHAYTDDEKQIPLIWESEYGSGKFVFDNFGIYTKEWRGFFAASYTLLKEITIYPVINGSCFYLDDFPSQIPSGNNQYIWRDYGTSTRDFYTNIWWPDMMNFADQFGLAYTGLAIQCYDDNVDGTTTSLADERTFLNFGNMLLRQGGEIGYHGYNHQPLCLSNCDYKGLYDYKTWDSLSAMEKSIDALISLCNELFPGVNMSVYVPPSNILSEEGEAMLAKEFPEITTISGSYFEEDEITFGCVQEFDIADSGVIHQPRIVSGCKLSPYMELASISELNMHLVNSHFTHPDDSLDPERGAELGWKALSEAFAGYLDWLYTAVPSLRNFTGSEMAAAVQRFVSLSLSYETSGDTLSINLGNFYDEAYLLVRFNEQQPDTVEGGSLEKLTDSLYLLKATQPAVTITLT